MLVRGRVLSLRRQAVLGAREAARARRRRTVAQLTQVPPSLPSGSSCFPPRSVPRTRRALRRPAGARFGWAAQADFESPAEIVTPRARSRRMRKKPEVASRTGVKPRASTRSERRHEPARHVPTLGPAPGNARLPMTMSAPVWRRTASMRRTSDGGWLRSASMTPTNSAVAAAKPSITAVPSPSLPALCATWMGKRCASSSATWPCRPGSCRPRSPARRRRRRRHGPRIARTSSRADRVRCRSAPRATAWRRWPS